MRRPTIVLTVLATAFAAGAAWSQEPPAEILRQVTAALPPAVGNHAEMKRLLTPAIHHPQLSGAFKLPAVQKSVGEALTLEKNCKVIAPATIAPPPCLYRGSGGSAFRAGIQKGKLDYLNPARHVDWVHREPNTIRREEAQATVLRLAADLGVPPGEVLASRIKLNDLYLGAATGENGKPTSLRAEVHVHLPRQVDGTRVFGSIFHAAIDSRGQVARFHAEWPDFVLRQGLSDAQTLPRDEVARRIALHLAQNFTGDDLAKVTIVIAYVPVDRLGGGRDTPDSETPALVRFEPALVIRALAPETGEDSGEIAPPLVEIVQPLLEAPATTTG